MHRHFLFALLTFVVAIVAVPCAVQAQPTAKGRYEAIIADAKSTMLVDPRQTIAKASAAKAIALTSTGTQRAVDVATAQWLEGEAHLRLNDANGAGPLLDAAYSALRDGPASKIKGDILRSRGGYHAAMANVAGALADYQAAFQIYHSIGETRSQAIALLSIAGLYQDARDFETALRYYGQALDVYQGDPQLLVSIYNNRGDALAELARYVAAERDFRAALKLARTMDSPVLEGMALRNIARFELTAGDLSAADRTIAEAFKLLGKGDSNDFAGQFWAVSAQDALQRGKLQQARTLIERAFLGVDIKSPTIVWWQAHRTAFDIYKALGDTDNALVHLEALKQLDDKTNKLAASTNTALMAAKFDYANQELRIQRLRTEEVQRRVSTQFWIFVASGVTGVVVVAMLGFGLITIRRSRNEVRAANIDLAATNTALGKALAAKTEFLATTSHEIRTPLNGILGMTQVMLADQRLDPTLRDRIGVVHGAGVSMRALVDDILDVAKMETGNLTIERAPIDLPAMLRDVSRMWEEQANSKGVGFELNLGDAPLRIESDPARLRQVVFNLLSNALKFTQNGYIRVSSGIIRSGEDEQVTIVIRDSGIGIPQDKLELIFESFRQADAGTTRQFGGTGLGLAICRNIARALGGDVTVTSSEGEGSCFTLAVPLVRVAEETHAANTVEGGAGLLIVDKNPISRAMLKTLFTARVATVKVASTIEEAVTVIAAGGISRVLIDEATASMNGDAEMAIATLKSVPVSLLWSNPSDDDRRRFADSGVDQLIAKPIAGAALVQAIVVDSIASTDRIDSRAA